MNREARETAIVDALALHAPITVHALAAAVGIDQTTLRTDLARLWSAEVAQYEQNPEWKRGMKAGTKELWRLT